MDDIQTQSIPTLLQEINDPPKRLYLRGKLPPDEVPRICFVGSRKYTTYGKDVCEHLIRALKGYDVSIVSGLALGIDSIAHNTALECGLHTIAVPGSGISDTAIYPRSHLSLAQKILSSGGALLSEFEPDFHATKWSFPQRNRIMAGLSNIVIIIEASDKSGTLITARLAMEYNREVCAVPGPIFSKNSEGPHRLIRDGATPITSKKDLLEVLGFESNTKPLTQKKLYFDLSEDEQSILTLLEKGPQSKNDIAENTSFSISHTNITLSLMELKGLVKEFSGKIHIK